MTPLGAAHNVTVKTQVPPPGLIVDRERHIQRGKGSFPGPSGFNFDLTLGVQDVVFINFSHIFLQFLFSGNCFPNVRTHHYNNILTNL